MQEVFEKIIEKLEDKRKIAEQLIMENPHDELDRIQTQTAEDFASAYNDAIEIVKQEAEKCKSIYMDGEYCWQSCWCTDRCGECNRLCNGDIDYYESYDARNNGWIPCSERLPKEQERWFGHDLTDAEPREFIVMVKGAYEPTTGYYHSGYGCWVKDLTSEYDDKNTGYGNEIVAWRFFPQPYQPKGE